jgi:Transglycosylase SLT domain
MGCRNLLLMIAAVATWSIPLGPAAGAQPAPKAKPSRHIAAQVNALIRKNAKNTELVTFANDLERPVKVVRGEKEPPIGATPHGSDEIITFSNEQMGPVRVMRGGPVVAAVSIALPVAPARRPVGVDVQVVSFADRRERAVTVLRGPPVARVDLHLATIMTNPYLELFGAARGADLDRVAFAVYGAESSHGADPAMWRPEFDGPQGPMQVSAAAALDSGGGDRFDLTQNRLLGRTYLARLYRRYGNWPDAVAAYNWGPGNMDAWIAQGRPLAGLPIGVAHYRDRVLRDGGIAQGLDAPLSRNGWQLPTP